MDELEKLRVRINIINKQVDTLNKRVSLLEGQNLITLAKLNSLIDKIGEDE